MGFFDFLGFGTSKVSPASKERKRRRSSQSKRSSQRKSQDKDEKEAKKKREPKTDALQYDPEDDVWALERAKPSAGRKFARSVMRGFNPVRLIANGLGLFPLKIKRAKDGTFSADFSFAWVGTILFCVSSCLIIGTTCWLLLSLIFVTVDVPKREDYDGKKGFIYRSEEIFIYKRNILFLVILSCSFIHLTVCMLAIFYRRYYIAKQLVYWTEVVELLHLNIGRKVATRIWFHMAVLGIFICGIFILYCMNIAPALAGSGSTFFILVVRLLDPYCLWSEFLPYAKHLLALFMLYVIVAGYVYILWFFYNCRLLINILQIWNNRFQFCLHKDLFEFAASKGEKKEVKKAGKKATRTSRGELFQDHIVIFNLMEGVNGQFEVIMESFYLSSMIMIVFELYGLVHTLFYSEYLECGTRYRDFYPILLFLFIQLYMYIVVTLEAAAVAEEARHILDICRRKGMLSSKSDNELWFMMSMRLTFGGHEEMGIIGAGFFHVTKAFLLGAVSAMVSFFIIFYQFEVPFAQTRASDTNVNKLDVKKILQQMEGIEASQANVTFSRCWLEY